MKRALAWLTRRLLRAAAAIGPEEKSEWIEAVLAEVESIEKPWEALRWAWGAFFFACRCRILAALGIVQENIIMNKVSAAYVVVFLVVVGVLLAFPTFRDAATVGLGPATVRLAFEQPGGPGPIGPFAMSDRELQRMAANAEQRGDASTMAFAATHMDDSQQGMELGKRAIALNPSLAWIKYFIINNAWRTDTRRATFGPEVHEVIAADPDNAVGYVLLAVWLRRTDPSLETRRAEWEAAMGKAFSAPTYDDYHIRSLQLEREIVREHEVPPFIAAWSMLNWPFPNLVEVKEYGKQLVAAGEPQACARAARFGNMMQSGQSIMERVVGQGLQTWALGALEKKFDLALVAPKTLRPTFPASGPENLWFATADAIVVQLALLIGGVAALVVAGCAAVLLLSRRKSARLEHLLRVAAITGVVAAVVTLLAYLPFSIAFSSYLKAKTAEEAFNLIIMFAGFTVLPWRLNMLFTTTQGHVYLWTLLILIGASTMMWRVVVHLQRRTTKPVQVGAH